jgi:hypothetical protein
MEGNNNKTEETICNENGGNGYCKFPSNFSKNIKFQHKM